MEGVNFFQTWRTWFFGQVYNLIFYRCKWFFCISLTRKMNMGWLRNGCPKKGIQFFHGEHDVESACWSLRICFWRAPQVSWSVRKSYFPSAKMPEMVAQKSPIPWFSGHPCDGRHLLISDPGAQFACSREFSLGPGRLEVVKLGDSANEKGDTMRIMRDGDFLGKFPKNDKTWISSPQKMDIIPNGDYGPVVLLTKLGCEQQN